MWRLAGSLALSLAPLILLLVAFTSGLPHDFSGFSTHYRYDKDGNAEFGAAWRVFNLHPLLMTLGFVTLLSNGVVAFKALQSTSLSHKARKAVHATLNFCAMACSIAAIAVVFGFKNVTENRNLYSGHSWAGFATFLLFALQWLMGFFSFVFPRFADEARASFLVVHKAVGAGLVLGIAASVVSGITDYLWIVEYSIIGKEKTDVYGTIFSLLDAMAVIVIINGIVVYAWLQSPSKAHKTLAAIQRTNTREIESLLSEEM